MQIANKVPVVSLHGFNMKYKILGFIAGFLFCPFIVWAGLETATYISDLIITNPTGSDLANTSDDHLRLIKSTIKNTFPSITGAVTATHSELNLIHGVTASTADLNQLDTNTFTSAATFPQNTFSANRITSTQNLPASTVTTLIFNSENFDVGSGHDTSTGIYTVPKTGYYLCSVSAFIQNNSVSTDILNSIYLSKNNATSGAGSRFDLNLSGISAGGTIGASSNAILMGNDVLLAAIVADTIRLKADVGAGGALTLVTTSYWGCYQLG